MRNTPAKSFLLSILRPLRFRALSNPNNPYYRLCPARGRRRPQMSVAASCAGQSFPIPGVEEALTGFIYGKRKATEVAHSVWANIIQKGDVVVDATCGNGHDTLALLKMIVDGSGRGCVYGMDIQPSALESTSSLLKESVDADEACNIQLRIPSWR